MSPKLNHYAELEPMSEALRKSDDTVVNWTEFLTDLVSRMAEISNDSGNATSGSTTSLTDTTRGWQVDGWINAWVAIEIGGVSYFRKITDNDATTLTFTAIPTAIVAGTPYSIKGAISLNDITTINGTSQTPGDMIALLTTISTAGLALGQYDEVQVSYPDTVTEVFTFKLATVTTYTVTLTYSDSTKASLVSVIRA